MLINTYTNILGDPHLVQTDKTTTTQEPLLRPTSPPRRRPLLIATFVTITPTTKHEQSPEEEEEEENKRESRLSRNRKDKQTATSFLLLTFDQEKDHSNHSYKKPRFPINFFHLGCVSQRTTPSPPPLKQRNTLFTVGRGELCIQHGKNIQKGGC